VAEAIKNSFWETIHRREQKKNEREKPQREKQRRRKRKRRIYYPLYPRR